MKKFFGAIENILMALFALFIIWVAIVPSGQGPRPGANKKSCIANMKTIEGAIELYHMENGQSTALTISDLVTKGYLKTEPKCRPFTKKFMGFAVQQPQPAPYRIMIMSAGIQPGQIQVDVECNVHGRLSLQDSTDSTKGL
ncbi:MAG TPA: hypothetical protein PKK26_00610 [Candidatus Wallbacteria bacterium]|nr:hypothetical protein [Candidatus Wallbacteria bacterium]